MIITLNPKHCWEMDPMDQFHYQVNIVTFACWYKLLVKKNTSCLKLLVKKKNILFKVRDLISTPRFEILKSLERNKMWFRLAIPIITFLAYGTIFPPSNEMNCVYWPTKQRIVFGTSLAESPCQPWS